MTVQSRVALLRQANDLLDEYRRQTQSDLGYWRSAFDDALTLSRLDDLNDYGELNVAPDAAMVTILEAETGASISDERGYVWEAFHDEVRDLAERVGVYQDPDEIEEELSESTLKEDARNAYLGCDQ